ncbi:hypothetical protein LWE61_15190 [Sphingobium sufflavum]|uniref:hypothetical protein n=1 Tax=Sphingobium sufflavum TaxID=1129547 RepID=UPI001F39BFD2|nr:hypothetical protein [Sphingobium sufflavum]MCE7797894.1 hypothetical protein [Sphingobium sufflavum]
MQNDPNAPTVTEEIAARLKRWCMNTGYDGGVNSPPMVALRHIEAQAMKMLALESALRGLIPTNLDALHPKIADDVVLPVDMTMGEVRAALRALAGKIGE